MFKLVLAGRRLPDKYSLVGTPKVELTKALFGRAVWMKFNPRSLCQRPIRVILSFAPSVVPISLYLSTLVDSTSHVL